MAQDYQPGTANGWGYFATNHVGQNTYLDNNLNMQHITRYWGMDHWASRVGQGTYFNWVVGNSILPYQDNNPNDQGVQIVDRQTVQDSPGTARHGGRLETDMDNANAGFTPLGLAQNAIPFDINPQQVTGSNPQTHFEQIYTRAVQALNNAVTAFNAAQNVTQELRQQQNSLIRPAGRRDRSGTGIQRPIDRTLWHALSGGHRTWGDLSGRLHRPDLIHYMYVDRVGTHHITARMEVSSRIRRPIRP